MIKKYKFFLKNGVYAEPAFKFLKKHRITLELKELI